MIHTTRVACLPPAHTEAVAHLHGPCLLAALGSCCRLTVAHRTDSASAQGASTAPGQPLRDALLVEAVWLEAWRGGGLHPTSVNALIANTALIGLAHLWTSNQQQPRPRHLHTAIIRHTHMDKNVAHIVHHTYYMHHKPGQQRAWGCIGLYDIRKANRAGMLGRDPFLSWWLYGIRDGHPGRGPRNEE